MILAITPKNYVDLMDCLLLTQVNPFHLGQTMSFAVRQLLGQHVSCLFSFKISPNELMKSAASCSQENNTHIQCSQVPHQW